MAAEVYWTTAAGGANRPDDEWWRTLVGSALSSNTDRRVVIHVACLHRTALVRDTAASLAAHLQHSGRRVAILDRHGNRAEWPPVECIEFERLDRVRLDAVCLRGGVAVPTLWFDDFALVTVAAVAPDARYGVAGILSATSELLGESADDDLGAIFEAHRLLAADLNVACGTRQWNSPDSGCWWAASCDDVALERAVASAAGADPARLPQLRYLARHELLDASTGTSLAPYALEGFLASKTAVGFARARARAATAARAFADDARLGAANLHRIPQFIERRWPGLMSFGRTTS